MVQHTKKWGVYHRDNSEGNITFKYEHDKKNKVVDYIMLNYSRRMRNPGESRVEIWNRKGKVMQFFAISE